MYIKEIEKPNISLPSPRLGFSCLVLISQFCNHHAERTNFARGSQCFDITKESSVCWRQTATKSYLTALSAIFLQGCTIRHFLKIPRQALEPKPCFCTWWCILRIIVKLACLLTWFMATWFANFHWQVHSWAIVGYTKTRMGHEV